MTAGYLAGVTVALIAFALATMVRIGSTPLDTGEAGLALIEFLPFIALHWLVALVPFIVVRKCGGFDSARLSTFVGGVLTAFLVLPFQVGLYVTIANIEESLSYFPTLGSVAANNWPLIIMSGALGGLTYALVKRRVDRLARAGDRDIGGKAGS